MATTTPAQAVRTLSKNGTSIWQTLVPHVPPHHSGLQDLLPRKVTREGIVLERHIREGRFQRSLALITGISGLLTGLEVGYEHYRGSYGQRIMYTPIILSFALCAAGIWGAFSRWAARTVLLIVSLIAMLDGVVGFFFHIRGIARKPGGWRIPVVNLVMGPPVFAPLLFSTVGFLGVIASLLRREDDPQQTLLPGLPRPRSAWLSWLPRRLTQDGVVFEQDVREGRFQRALGIAAAASAFFSWVEAFYSHYKNNFQYKIQWLPIFIAPVLVVAGLATIWSRTVARTLLPISSALAFVNGSIGFYYHARGVKRRPGGLKKPLYNIMYGPPILAPLIFAASGFIGILASLLRRAK